MKVYNKLVRDKIPEIINNDNEFENIRKGKVEARGAFQERIFLEKVIEDGE